MVKRCSYGSCNSDDRYPERLGDDIKFVPFPKPKTNLEKCLRWIKLCGRPHEQVNPSKIDKNKFVCTKHFVNKKLPTAEFPDPLPSTQTIKTPMSARKPPKKRKLEFPEHNININQNGNVAMETEEPEPRHAYAESQTESQWIDPMDFLSLAMENETLKRTLAQSILKQDDTQRLLLQKPQQGELKKQKYFSVEDISQDEKLIKYYTGFTSNVLYALFKLLVPNTECSPLTYLSKGNLSLINQLSLKNQVFLTLCKLRNNYALQDIGYRFGMTQQVAAVIFNSWIDYMFLRCGELSIWPHKNVISEHMPEKYKVEFPNTFCIIDYTELIIQKPSSLKTQSQSDYKSTNTLKALVDVDTRGSVIFSSMMFTGCMSDKLIFKKSGFETALKDLIEIGYLEKGDGIMADKGFDIQSEVEETGLTSPFVSIRYTNQPAGCNDVILTKKIAKYRVHVERAVRRIKSFKILSGRISLSMMSSMDPVWYVCSFLTDFMPLCIKKK